MKNLKQIGSACPLCKKWVKWSEKPNSWDWHYCIEKPKHLKLVK